MTMPLRPVVGLITIGQSPRSDVVPEMAAVIGPGIEVLEAGALDGLTRSQIDALRLTGDDEILVTRLTDGTAVFVGKQKIVGRVEAQIAALERRGATITALLCTGAFPPLTAVRPLVQPQPLLRGALRAMRWSGRLGVVTPSVPHVPQTTERWRRDGFDPLVVALSPYEEEDANAIARVAGAFREAGAGLIAMDCMGFRRKTRDELRGLTGAPVLLADLMVARVLGELCGG
jgi:protein AroM